MHLQQRPTREYQGLEWFRQVFGAENHQSVIAPTVSRGQRYIYGSFP